MKGSLKIFLIIIIFLIFGFFLLYPRFLSEVKEGSESFLQEEKTNSWLSTLQENFNQRCQQSIKEIQADQAWQTIKNFFQRLVKEKLTKVLNPG